MNRSGILRARNNDVFTHTPRMHTWARTHTTHTCTHTTHTHMHTHTHTQLHQGNSFTVMASCCVCDGLKSARLFSPVHHARLNSRSHSPIRSLCKAAKCPRCEVVGSGAVHRAAFSVTILVHHSHSPALVLPWKTLPEAGHWIRGSGHTYWWDSAVKLPAIKVTRGCIPPTAWAWRLSTPLYLLFRCVLPGLIDKTDLVLS